MLNHPDMNIMQQTPEAALASLGSRPAGLCADEVRRLQSGVWPQSGTGAAA
ncbi:hypothetical protein [Paludibacterium denitrificans]|uniref:hypothetical protein n=1 Tax=Paludibacterium denitrificans TaxID=2675226 RepID=UPI001E4C7099|nr:hypothetical protein [Paludibacterium denitrificans]